MLPEVSIIIVNWNTQDPLRDCLRSVVEQTRSPFEIIVVDNASADSSVQMVKTEFPQAILIANNANRGFAAANNQAIAIARGRYLLLLNPDTVVFDGAINKMLAWISDRPEVGCAGCQIMASGTKIQRTCFTNPGPLNILLTESGLKRIMPDMPWMQHPEYASWDRRSEMDVDVVSGMFMLIPRSVIDKVGPMDEIFFVYAEEADLCRRIHAAGLRCVFTPIARVMHTGGGGKSTEQIKPRMHVQLQKSLMAYNRKHYGLPGAMMVKLIYLASASLRWTIFCVMSLLFQGTEMSARAHLAKISVLYHLIGTDSKS